VGHVQTGNDGRFSFLHIPQIKYALQISKPGYETKIMEEANFQNPEAELMIGMEKIKHALPAREQLVLFSRQILEMLFELLLVLSLVLEIAMTWVWGWEKTLIFLAVSTLNLVLWVTHLIHQNVQTK
jgi:hypothetical protein